MFIDPNVPENNNSPLSEHGGNAASVNPSPASEPEVIREDNVVTAVEDHHLQEAAMAAMADMKSYHIGDMVEGTIVQVTDDSIIVDVGTKTEGIITRDEISIGTNPDMSEFKVGDKISAVVIDEDEEGQYKLSKRRADQKLVWSKVDESFKDGTRIHATGFRAVKGGLLVDIGTIAFLPQSLLDIRRIDDMESLVGQKFEVKVVEYDREAKPHPKIVVSRRAILEEDLTLERDRVYDDLKAGSVVDGKVVKLTNYGAFIDVGGLQGLLHISEMSLGRINHPSEVMQEGDTIKVKIVEVDKKKKRISLGRRELLPNPWDVIGEKYKPGMVVEGIVVRTAEFGAFVRLDDYFEGLAHISELVDNKISHAKEVFNPGDKVNVLIMAIEKKNRRIKLSIKRAADAQRRSEVAEFMKNQGELQNVFAAQLLEAYREIEKDIIEPPAPEPETALAPEPEPPKEEKPEAPQSYALAEEPESEIEVTKESIAVYEPEIEKPKSETEMDGTPI